MKNLVYLLLFATVFSSNAQNTAESLETFNKIDVFGPFRVELIKADKDAIEMDYRGVDREYIVGEVSRGVLRLKLRNKQYWNEWTNNDYPRHKYIRVKVYYTQLTAIEAQAGAEIFSNQVVKSKNLAIECSMGAELSLDILSKNLYTKSTMGAIVELDGQTEHHEVKASMGGVLKASRLTSKFATVSASMGAEVDVRATEEIEVSAGFGAEVNYAGSPNVRHTSKNFGAEVRGH